MDVNRTSAEVLRQPVVAAADNRVYLWLIIGCSLGAAAFITLVIAAYAYLRRRRTTRKGCDQIINHSGYIPGSEFCPQRMISSFSSSASEDTTDITSDLSGGRYFRRPLGPSTSLDPPALLRLTSECVQPRPTLTRWHTVTSAQTTPILMDTERDSDDEVSHSPPCLHGRLWFSVNYKPELEQLQIILHRVKYLPGRDLVNSPRDPFVKLYLLPDEENFQQSKIRKRTLNPKFNETFTFQVSPPDISKRTLKLSVYDVDKRKVRHCLGHVVQPLDQIQKLKESIVSRDLEIIPQSNDSSGEIQLCLSCNPFSNRIKVTVCRVRNLQELSERLTGVFVKIELHHGRRLVKSKRTQSIRGGRESELVYDESFSFGVSGRFFDSCSLAFVVAKDEDSALVGKVVIGPFMYARGEQLQHWQEMLSNPRNTVTRWHPLEKNSGQRKKS